jgi:predicted DNA-binding transcriptional regulator YafY
MSKSNSTSPQTRPPLERMLRIHKALQGGEYPNATSLALKLEVSSKSVHRDIDFMRDRLRLPIEFDAVRRGYHYTQEVEAFPTIQITEGELFALLVAERALQQYRGTSFERPLLSAIRKLEESLQDTVSLNLREVERSISFRTRAEPILDLGVFDQLARATSTCQQLEIAYKKPGQASAEPRTIDPCHLANINGEWFLFAYDHLRKDIRTFVPSRIKSIRATGKHFSRPQKFSLDRRLRDSFGVISGEGLYDVVLRFDARAADYIKEKKWHPSQQLRDLRGGEIELRMRLSSLDEVQRWVLSWAGSARVVGPPELAGAIHQAAMRIAGPSRRETSPTKRGEGKENGGSKAGS